MRTPRQGDGHALRKNWPACLVACCLILAAALTASVKDTWPHGQGAPAVEGRWAILVTGLSGDADLQKQYLKELVDLRGLLEGALAFPRDHVYALSDAEKVDSPRIQYQSTRENLLKVCKEITGRAGKGDLVFIFLEGHGNVDEDKYKLNLVGPDPTGEELAEMFYSIPAERFAVINATSCSGGSLEALSGRGRIVVSATKSGNERNLTHFGRYFIEAFVNNNADVDKNGRISIFEAFTYAARKVEEYYTKSGSLPTEHPVLSDNGGANALTLAEAGDQIALLSRAAYLDSGSPLYAQAGSDPETRALVKEAQALEKQIELLKTAKGEMKQEEYDKQLEGLLIKLAEVQAKLRKK